MGERGGEFIKFDVSKLSRKANVLPKSVQERAFLGEDNEGLYRRQIANVADDFDRNNVMDRSVSERETRTADVLHRNFNVYSVSELRDKQRDPNLPEYVRDNLKKQESRLAKSVLVALKNKGVAESDLVAPGKVESLLPSGLKGIGEKVSSLIITDEGIKAVLGGVDLYKNQIDVPEYGEKKEMVLDQILVAEKEVKKALVRNKSQAELALSYLHSLKSEVDENHEKEDVTDVIVDFLNDHVLRKDVTVDADLSLKSVNGSDDFAVRVNSAGEKEYVHRETVEWLRQRNAKASELIMICSGGEFSTIEEMNQKLAEGGHLSRFYTRDDGSTADKEYIEGLKDALGFCVYEAIEDSGVKANMAILGTLNTRRVDRLLPKPMDGLSDEVVINAATDPFLREQLRSICLLDKDEKFRLVAIHGGLSTLGDKEQLVRDINTIVNKVVGDKRMGVDKKYTSEARRIQKWLLERNEIYNHLIEQQISIGRYGEKIPGGEGLEAMNARLGFARKLLDYVEDSGSPPGSLNIMDQCTKLFEMSRSDKVEQEIKDEIHARLHLAFMYYHMHAAGGLLNNRGQSIEDAHEQGYKEGMLIDKTTMIFLLKSGANGLPVAECWDEIEKMNFGDEYHKILMEMMGIHTGDKKEYVFDRLVPGTEAAKFLFSVREAGINYLIKNGDSHTKEQLISNDSLYLSAWTNEMREKFLAKSGDVQNPESFFWGQKGFRDADGNFIPAMCYNHFTDVDVDRKGMVRDFVLGKIRLQKESSLKEKFSYNEDDFKKSWNLALNLMEATAEDSVFNPCFAGHNDFSELILTEANTKDRQKKMKVIGPRKVVSKVVSLYTTWPRYIAGEKEENRRSVFGPLLSKDINPSRMDEPKSESYFLYTAILPKKILPVQSFIMKEDVSAKDTVNIEAWKKLFDPVSKVISYGQNVLLGSDNVPIKVTTKDDKEKVAADFRSLMVEGVLQVASRPSVGFNWGSLYTLGTIVTQPFTIIDSVDGRVIQQAFMSRSRWEEIFRSAEMSEKMRERMLTLGIAKQYEDLDKGVEIKFKF